MDTKNERQTIYTGENLTVTTPSSEIKHYDEDGKDIYENGEIKLTISQDSDPSSPREWDNLGIMLCIHKRYNLGDSDAKLPGVVEYAENLGSWDEVEKYLEKERGATAILPLYLYDHSGITMKTSPFGDRWDSGQVGFIYTTDPKIKEAYGVAKVTPAIRKKAEQSLQEEVETYDDFLTGNVYGFTVEHKLTGEMEDSVWGFYGSDIKKNGILESLPEHARDLVKNYEQQQAVKAMLGEENRARG